MRRAICRAALDAHGGYLLRPEGLSSRELAELAQEALSIEGLDPMETSLQVSVLPSQRVMRVAYDAPFTYGRRGARWYRDHHAFARLASRKIQGAIHAYAIDPSVFEAVFSFGNGRRVGGESFRYEEAEMDFEEEDEASFEKMREKWPLGHLAKVFGVSRQVLLRLPWHESALWPLGQIPDLRDGEQILAPLLRRTG
jgi:hypothetical protein